MHFVDDKSHQLYIRGGEIVQRMVLRLKMPDLKYLYEVAGALEGGHYCDSLHVAVTNATLTFREVRWLLAKPEL